MNINKNTFPIRRIFKIKRLADIPSVSILFGFSYVLAIVIYIISFDGELWPDMQTKIVDASTTNSKVEIPSEENVERNPLWIDFLFDDGGTTREK